MNDKTTFHKVPELASISAAGVPSGLASEVASVLAEHGVSVPNFNAASLTDSRKRKLEIQAAHVSQSHVVNFKALLRVIEFYRQYEAMLEEEGLEWNSDLTVAYEEDFRKVFSDDEAAMQFIALSPQAMHYLSLLVAEATISEVSSAVDAVEQQASQAVVQATGTMLQDKSYASVEEAHAKYIDVTTRVEEFSRAQPQPTVQEDPIIRVLYENPEAFLAYLLHLSQQLSQNKVPEHLEFNGALFSPEIQADPTEQRRARDDWHEIDHFHTGRVRSFTVENPDLDVNQQRVAAASLHQRTVSGYKPRVSSVIAERRAALRQAKAENSAAAVEAERVLNSSIISHSQQSTTKQQPPSFMKRLLAPNEPRPKAPRTSQQPDQTSGFQPKTPTGRLG